MKPFPDAPHTQEPTPVEDIVLNFQHAALSQLEAEIEAGRVKSKADFWATIENTQLDLAPWLNEISDEVKEETIRPLLEEKSFAQYLRLPLQQRFEAAIQHLGQTAAGDDLRQILDYMKGAELTTRNLVPGNPYSEHEPAQVTKHRGALVLCYRDLPQKPKHVDLHLLLIREHRFHFQRILKWSLECDWLHPYCSPEEFKGATERRLLEYPPEMQERIRTWLKIGYENPWIRQAYDPPFSIFSFRVCADIDELADQILRGNWCLGQAFVLGDICFINQVDGGDEWLTIKGASAFDSITMQTYDESRAEAETWLRKAVPEIQSASEIQCRRGEYGHPYELAPIDEYELVPESEAAMATAGYDLMAVVRNGSSIFVLTQYPQGDILLEFFRSGSKPTQSARIAVADTPKRLGCNFLELDSMEQFQRVLPFLQPAHHSRNFFSPFIHSHV